MDDIREFIIEAAGFAFSIESLRMEDDELVFVARATRQGEEHRLEVTIREQPQS
jgi:hypothetical protein